MKIFKLRKGKSRIYSLTTEEYEQTTQLKYPFKTVGKDGTTRYFAICPWCDNPIRETMSMNFFKSVDGLPKVLFSLPIQINELRFMNWITSEKAQKYRKSPRNQRLLQIADDMMGTLKNS